MKVTQMKETSMVTPEVKNILSHYEGMSSATRENLTRILMHGKLGGTGKLVILPVDQGFEHGPARSFAKNAAAYDPHYHYQLAIDAGLNAYAAPLGFLEAGMDTFAGKIPTILKVNSSNSLAPKAAAPNQAVTGSVQEALRLGCAAIGFTIYPGSAECFDMMEEIREMTEEAKAAGLVVVIWSYPRGADISKEGETAMDVTAYAAHMAALMGAHIIKVKPPTAHLEQLDAKKVYESEKIDISTPAARFKHITQACFNGKRIVVFSGGNAKGEEDLLNEARAIRDGGGNGSIIGRNTFQRPRAEALKLLENMIRVYKRRDVKPVYHYLTYSSKPGFTLIEISVVLVIIGLLTGSIIIGKELIAAARLRAFATQLESFKAAISTFKGKYNAMPGDMEQERAESFGLFASQVANPTAQGDGNGLIEGGGPGSSDAIGETLIFWRHLSESKLIPGDFGAAIDPATGAIGAPIIYDVTPYLPSSKLGRSGVFIAGSGSNVNMLSTISIYSITALGGIININPIPTFTPNEAWALDRKIDDGLADSGTFGVALSASMLLTLSPIQLPLPAVTCIQHDASMNLVYATIGANGDTPSCNVKMLLR